LEGKLQELEVRLEAKIEAKNAQLEEKVWHNWRRNSN
jgi:hypothetical protein